MHVQGALDGGLDIPHGEKRFVGYSAEDKKLDPEQLKKYILGGHVSLVQQSLIVDCDRQAIVSDLGLACSR